LSSGENKARAIFNWMEGNIRYGSSQRSVGYRNSAEVMRDNEGVCGEMAFLYVPLARLASLTSGFVIVDRDDQGRKVHHACAYVETNRHILVDPAYHQFDIRHRDFRYLSDREAMDLFGQYRKTQ